MEELTGRQFGSYRVVTALGQGGMAAIYKAFQPAVNRHVALKILSHHFTSDPEFFQRFRHEAAILAQLQHPHILPIFDFGEADGYAFLAMPFIDAGTLAGLLKGVPVALDIVERVMSQVGDALDYAHSKGIVHRDIKPSNILMDGRGNCLVADFGIARMAEGATRLTMTGTIMGTPEYMSPEQAMGEKAGPASDIYSLGIVLYEMLTGRVPFRADTPIAVAVKHINAPLPPPRTLNPSLTPEVEAVVVKALARSPSDRFESATAFSKALTAAVRAPRETSPVETREAPPMETIVRRPTDRMPVEPRPATYAPQAPTTATVVKPPTGAPLVKPATSGVPVRRRKRIAYVSVALVLAALAAGAYVVLRQSSYRVTTIAPPSGCEISMLPEVSSDGRYLAYYASCASAGSDNTQLIMADRETGAVQVVEKQRFGVNPIRMTPDGRYLFFWRGTFAEIVRYDRVSKQSITIKDLKGYQSPAALSVSGDGRYVATGVHFLRLDAEGKGEPHNGAHVADLESDAVTPLAECDDCVAKISSDGQWVGWTIGSTIYVSKRTPDRVWQRSFPGDLPNWQFGRSLKPQDEPVVYLTAVNGKDTLFHRYHPMSDQSFTIGALAGTWDFDVASDSRSILFVRLVDQEHIFRIFHLDLVTEDVVSIGQFPYARDAIAQELWVTGGTDHVVAHFKATFDAPVAFYALDR